MKQPIAKVISAVLSLLVLGAGFCLAVTDKYRLTLRDDPATTVVIGWNQVSGTGPVVYYGTTDYGTNWSAYPLTHTPDRTISYLGMNNNFARITGLQPNTAYYFVIKDSEGTSARFWFRTAPDTPAERLSFIAGGDSRNNRVPRQNANKLVAKLRPHAVFFGGDMTNTGTNAEWTEWMDDWQLTIASDGRMFPVVAARGNHESSNAIIENLFDVPDPNVYYALTFAGGLIRSYTLNTEISISGNQTTWLSNDLAANAGATWKMVQYHKPIRPHVSTKVEGTAQYSNWAQLFYDQGVRLVVECDAHTVKTTWPVKPETGAGSAEGFIREDVNGVVYTGEGCWGAPLRTNDDNKTWTRASGVFNQFKWIFVGQDTIEIRTIDINNADQVGGVNDNDLFTPPANLNIWNPPNGDVVYIIKSTGAPNQAPAVSLTLPSNGASYPAPQQITINADASDVDGTVQQVEFFAGGATVGTDNTAPFSVTWTIPANGLYLLTAVATDDDGAQTASSAVAISVGSFSDSFCVQIVAGEDDVEESQSGAMYSNSSDLELVFDAFNSNNNQTVGMRFRSLEIPQGAAITSAYLQFTVDEVTTGTCNLVLFGEYGDDAGPFSSAAFDVSSRTQTGASVNWSVVPWATVGQAGADQRSPDISPVIQEIVDRPGWNVNNAIILMITGSGTRTAESYEGAPASAPTLCIDYTVSGSTGAEARQALDPVKIRVMPNPIRDELNVLLVRNYLKQPVLAELSVYDVSGKLCLQGRHILSGSTGTVRIDSSNLQPGQYFISMKGGTFSLIEKFIKF